MDHPPPHMDDRQPVRYRDRHLDVAKGVAIILVVVGHYVQVTDSQFDASALFRVIYAFHMPLFVVLAGASASFWFRTMVAGNDRQTVSEVVQRLQRTTLRLLLPFVTWTWIRHYHAHGTDDIANALSYAFGHPDHSLWFLLCIYYCTLLLLAWQLILGAIRAMGVTLQLVPAGSTLSTEARLVTLWLAWKISLRYMQAHFQALPLATAIGLVDGYLLYFFVGLYYREIRAILDRTWHWLAITVIFIVTVPYWSRIGLHNLVDDAPGWLARNLRKSYPLLVALSGSLSLMYASRLVDAKFRRASRWIAECGIASLGIYAMHEFFLFLRPPVLAPLILSFAVFKVLERIPVCNVLLFGDYRKPRRQTPAA